MCPSHLRGLDVCASGPLEVAVPLAVDASHEADACVLVGKPGEECAIVPSVWRGPHNHERKVSGHGPVRGDDPMRVVLWLEPAHVEHVPVRGEVELTQVRRRIPFEDHGAVRDHGARCAVPLTVVGLDDVRVADDLVGHDGGEPF